MNLREWTILREDGSVAHALYQEQPPGPRILGAWRGATVRSRNLTDDEASMIIQGMRDERYPPATEMGYALFRASQGDNSYLNTYYAKFAQVDAEFPLPNNLLGGGGGNANPNVRSPGILSMAKKALSGLMT